MQASLFDWLSQRSAGLLLHPTSLPGSLGIGGFGQGAYRLLDLMERAGMRYWQVCPLGPTGFGDSPYQCFSAFAGNPYLIDLEPMPAFDLLQDHDLEVLRALPADRADYGALFMRVWPLLRLVHRRFKEKGLSYLPNYGFLDDFVAEHEAWLRPFATFMALKNRFNGQPWNQWPKEVRTWKAAADSAIVAEEADTVEAHIFYQYLFYGQWSQIRRQAAAKGISIIGDVPIFVALDSADVWANPELFELDKAGVPTTVAGVPPDYFSEKGQLWGNPLFRWDVMAKDGYAWWLDRLRANLMMYDVIRLDHFRGFESYWRIPAEAEDARAGDWAEGPGMAFFEQVKETFPEACLIAEDLGLITDDVRKLLRQTGLPGMAVLQFAFSGVEASDNLYLPHNLQQNLVLYPGTHDNDTTLGWYAEATEEARDHVRRYFRISGDEIGWDFIRAAYASVAGLAVIPMQDVLSIGGEGRFNTPGESQGNWQWRMSWADMDRLEHGGTLDYLNSLGMLYNRG